jgi:hypothetical protein
MPTAHKENRNENTGTVNQLRLAIVTLANTIIHEESIMNTRLTAKPMITCALFGLLGLAGCSSPDSMDNGASQQSEEAISSSQTLAVNFPTKVGCGGNAGSGYVQSCNGYIATPFSAAASGTYSITVDAGGQYGVGGWPNMVLIVDGAVRGSWTVALWAPSTHAFTASVNLGAGSHTLEIAFTNDAYAPGTQYPDRNLYIYDAVITPTATSYSYTCSFPGGDATMIVQTSGSSAVAYTPYDTSTFTYLSETATTITYAWTGSSNNQADSRYHVTIPRSALQGVKPFQRRDDCPYSSCPSFATCL